MNLHILAGLTVCLVAVVLFGAVFYWIPLLLGAPLIPTAILFAAALLIAIAILESQA